MRRFVADRSIDVERMFTHRWRLDQADEAYPCSTRRPPARGLSRRGLEGRARAGRALASR